MDGMGGSPKATNGIEQCEYRTRTGKFYLNIPEVNGPGDHLVAGAVLVINPRPCQSRRPGRRPRRLRRAAGHGEWPSNQILLGCNAPSGNGKATPTVIINERSGAITHVLDNESGSDEVWFNSNDGHYFLARPSTSKNKH
jgi:hypothetical protein